MYNCFTPLAPGKTKIASPVRVLKKIQTAFSVSNDNGLVTIEIIIRLLVTEKSNGFSNANTFNTFIPITDCSTVMFGGYYPICVAVTEAITPQMTSLHEFTAWWTPLQHANL